MSGDEPDTKEYTPPAITRRESLETLGASGAGAGMLAGSVFPGRGPPDDTDFGDDGGRGPPDESEVEGDNRGRGPSDDANGERDNRGRGPPDK